MALRSRSKRRWALCEPAGRDAQSAAGLSKVATAIRCRKAVRTAWSDVSFYSAQLLPGGCLSYPPNLNAFSSAHLLVLRWGGRSETIYSLGIPQRNWLRAPALPAECRGLLLFYSSQQGNIPPLLLSLVCLEKQEMWSAVLFVCSLHVL